MDGKEIVKRIETELFLKDISKGEFYKSCGLNSTTMSNWRNGTFNPSPAKLQIVANYLGIDYEDLVSDNEPQNGMDEETAELLEMLKDRQDLRILLRSGRDVPPSSVYELVSRLEKMKEDAR